MLGHEFSRKWVGVEDRSSFPPSRWKIEILNEKTTDPVFIVILGCEKHVQLLTCVYLAVLCDITLRALLSSIVNSMDSAKHLRRKSAPPHSPRVQAVSLGWITLAPYIFRVDDFVLVSLKTSASKDSSSSKA